MDKKFSARDIAFLGLIGVILFCAFFALKALDSSPAPTEECSPCMNRVLEQLSCQNQLLVDLLGAVNSLTAAILSGKNKS